MITVPATGWSYSNRLHNIFQEVKTWQRQRNEVKLSCCRLMLNFTCLGRKRPLCLWITSNNLWGGRGLPQVTCSVMCILQPRTRRINKGGAVSQSQPLTQSCCDVTEDLIGWRGKHTHTGRTVYVLLYFPLKSLRLFSWASDRQGRRRMLPGFFYPDYFSPVSQWASPGETSGVFKDPGWRGTHRVCLESSEIKLFYAFLKWKERESWGWKLSGTMPGNGGVYAVKRRKKPVQKRSVSVVRDGRFVSPQAMKQACAPLAGLMRVTASGSITQHHHP